MLAVESSATEWKSPIRKLVRFFKGSRDKWKAKFQVLRRKCKRLENQLRAVKKSRKGWKDRARRADGRWPEPDSRCSISKRVQS